MGTGFFPHGLVFLEIFLLKIFFWIIFYLDLSPFYLATSQIFLSYIFFHVMESGGLYFTNTGFQGTFMI